MLTSLPYLLFQETPDGLLKVTGFEAADYACLWGIRYRRDGTCKEWAVCENSRLVSSPDGVPEYVSNMIAMSPGWKEKSNEPF